MSQELEQVVVALCGGDVYGGVAPAVLIGDLGQERLQEGDHFNGTPLKKVKEAKSKE